jgi:hypothetical protein
MSHLSLYVLPTWHRDKTAEILNIDALHVHLEYSVEEPEKWGKFCDRGFVTPVSSPGDYGIDLKTLDPWKAAHTYLAGLFPIESFQEFVDT